MTEWQWQVILAICRILLTMNAATGRYMAASKDDLELLQSAVEGREHR